MHKKHKGFINVQIESVLCCSREDDIYSSHFILDKAFLDLTPLDALVAGEIRPSMDDISIVSRLGTDSKFGREYGNENTDFTKKIQK